MSPKDRMIEQETDITSDMTEGATCRLSCREPKRLLKSHGPILYRLSLHITHRIG